MIADEPEIESMLGAIPNGKIAGLAKQRCLITGGAGFIGSWLAKALSALGAEVYVVDNLWRGSLDNLRSPDGRPFIDLERRFIYADLREYHACLSACLQADIVFHLADIVAGIDYVFSNQSSLFRTNILVNSNMISAAQTVGVQKFIYVGAACSYPKELQARPGQEPLREEQAYPANPESAYGWSKLMGEYESELMGQSCVTQVGILRFHNVYGPRSDMSVERSQVIPSLIRKAVLFPAEKYTVWGSGQQTRSFVYVLDVIEALLVAATVGLGKGPIQIGTTEETSIKELALKIAKISGKGIEPEFDRSKPEGDVGRCANWEKAERLLGWRPRTSIDEGLKRTYEWAAYYLDKVRKIK